jgi:hypothetical protein
MRERLRAALAEHAAENQNSLHDEMVHRLEMSLQANAMSTIHEVADEMSRTWGRIRKEMKAA